jgi:hypothetical protein
MDRDGVLNIVRPVARGIALAIVGAGIAGAARAADDFPLTGNYTQNVACKGDGSDPATAKVTISPDEIVSNVGVCTILDKKRDGQSISARVECKFAGGPLMGDITFTLRPDNTVEFIDRDMTYKAVLYRCPQ